MVKLSYNLILIKSRSMKILTVYYSRTRTTKKLAENLNELLKGDLEEIVDLKNRQGWLGYVMAGRDASTKRQTIIKDLVHNPADYDLIVIGTPIWAWTVTPAVRSYLIKNKDKIKKVAFFCTESGQGGPRAFQEMENICGQKPIATLELLTREVIKDLFSEKAGNFIKTINDNIKNN
jgi:flavodoxin